jgi:CheY-like chemotaxis protein
MVHDNFVGHPTLSGSTNTAPPVSTCLPIRMPVRILIAEDNPTVRTALRGLLEDAGPWEVVVVENGQQAIAKAQEIKPSLIILDLVMPVMDGLKAARQISQLMPEIPLLMHTMHWSQQVELEAQKVGVRKVVPKSDSRLLISTVQQFLVSEAPSASADNATVSADIPTPEVAPPLPILESGGAAPSGKAAAPSSAGSADLSKNRPPN